MLIYIKLIFSVFIIAFLSGCGARGPMQESWGPINTPVFKPIILDTLNDGSKDINFKETLVGLYENKEFKGFGNLVISEYGVYYVRWNIPSYVYSSLYQIKVSDIKSIQDDIVIRSFLPDSEILVIEDNRGQKIGFSLNKRLAAKEILFNLINKNFKNMNHLKK